MPFRPITAAMLLLAATGPLAALAQEATDPNVQARQALMRTIGQNSKVLGDMASGQAGYDAAAAEAAKAALAAAAAEIPARFEIQGAADPESTALPEIWTNWDDFVAKGQALEAAVNAADVSSASAIQASMGGIGGACSACHRAYRAQN